jgi:hypothetical protein
LPDFGELGLEVHAGRSLPEKVAGNERGVV